MKKTNKTMKRVVAGCLVLGILASVGIGAYLTDTETKTDVYTVGNVQAEIVSNGDMELDNVGALLPGTVHAYERAAMNTGINDAYVFMSLTIPYEMVGVSDEDGTQIGERVRQLFIPGVEGGYIGSEWKLVDVGYIGQYEIEDNGQYCGEHDAYSAVVGDTITYVYGYIGDNADGALTALKSGETTSNLVETMQLTNLYRIDKINGQVSTKLYAIQSNNVNGGITDVNGVWAVINKAISGEHNEASTLTYSIRNTNTGDSVGYAPLKLVDENGNTIATSVATENGTGQFQNVPAGNYTVETVIGDLSVTNTASSYTMRRAFASNRAASIEITGEDQSVVLGLTTVQNTLAQGSVFNDYIPDNITSIEFVAMPQTYGLNDATLPAGAFDVSEAADGSIMAWIEDTTMYVASMNGEMIYANPNCDNMFQNKYMLTYIGIENLSTVNMLHGKGFFEGCTRLAIDINDFDFSNLRSLERLFTACVWLTEFTIPSTIETIDYNAFSYCDLISITIPESVKTIGNSAFYGCSKLTSVSIPSSVERIDDLAFANCTALTSIDFPEGVKSIGNNVFELCYSLTSVKIPASVTEIGLEAFDVTPALISINVDPANKYYTSVDGVLFTKDMKTLIVCPVGKIEPSFTIPDGVETICSNAFLGCSNLYVIDIPASVTKIGKSAFDGTKWLETQRLNNPGQMISVNGIIVDTSNLSGEVVIPDGTTEISESMFQGNANITSVYIPASVTKIGDKAFMNCSSLTTVTIEHDSQLKSIGKSAFSGCRSLTSFEIPNTVETIGDSAFLSCSGIKSIELPASLNSIGTGAFTGTSLTSVTIPNNVTNVDRVFNSCYKLTECIVAENHPTYTSVDGVLFTKDMKTLVQYPAGKSNTAYTVPEGVTTIGDYAFSNCSYLSTITLPASLTEIGARAFQYCSALTSITIPEGVKSIGQYAFYCSGVTSVYFSDNVEVIGDYAFSECFSLTTIDLPASLKSVGEWAFAISMNLKTINYRGTQAQWNQVELGSNWNVMIASDYVINFN